MLTMPPGWKLFSHLILTTLTQSSRSASDKYTGIIEKTGSQNASAFHRSINGTLFSGEFSKSLTSEREAVGAYFASGFIDQ